METSEKGPREVKSGQKVFGGEQRVKMVIYELELRLGITVTRTELRIQSMHHENH